MLSILITESYPSLKASEQDIHGRQDPFRPSSESVAIGAASGGVVTGCSWRPTPLGVHPFLKVLPEAVGIPDLGFGHGPTVLLKGMEEYE